MFYIFRVNAFGENLKGPSSVGHCEATSLTVSAMVQFGPLIPFQHFSEAWTTPRITVSENVAEA